MRIKTDYGPILQLILAIILTAIFIVFSLKYLFPIVIGIIIAFIIEPIVSFLERKTKFDRGVITAVVLAAIYCIVGYISVLIIARLIFELGRLIKFLPTQLVYYESLLNKGYLFFVDFFANVPEDVLIYIKANFNQIFSSLIGSISNYYSFLVNRIGMLPNLFINVFVILIFVFLFAYFFTKDMHKIIESIKNVFPEYLQEKVKSVQFELLFSFIRLIKSELFLVMISTIITVTGFYILRVDYALILGIICGVLDFLPVLGPSLVFIPWIIFTIIMGNTNFAIGLLVLYVIILGSRQLLQAKIIGHNLGIDPLLTLISIYLGITIFGWMGIFIGPLVTVIVRALTHSGIIPPLRKV